MFDGEGLRVYAGCNKPAGSPMKEEIKHNFNQTRWSGRVVLRVLYLHVRYDIEQYYETTLEKS